LLVFPPGLLLFRRQGQCLENFFLAGELGQKKVDQFERDFVIAAALGFHAVGPGAAVKSPAVLDVIAVAMAFGHFFQTQHQMAAVIRVRRSATDHLA